MSERRRDATEIRLELARGHWELDERAEALACLERAAAREPAHAGLVECVEALFADPAARLDLDLERRLVALRERVGAGSPGHEDAGSSRLATSTMAELLAEQGHADRALEVADEVLRRSPDDARALAVRRRVAGSDAAAPASNLERAARAAAQIDRLEVWLDRLKRRRQEATA